jgi:acid phosphatase (class A)
MARQPESATKSTELMVIARYRGTRVNRLLGILTPVALALVWEPVLLAQSAATYAGGPTGAFQAYLPADAVSAKDLIGSPPGAGSARQAYDRAVFQATRAAANTSLWALAINDGGKGVLRSFSCSAGVVLDGRVPALTKLLTRLRTDLINLTRMPADQTPYPAPSGAAQRAVCIEPKAGAPLHSEYPSLQAAWGWTIAMLLAEGLPEHANDLYRRGRAYGDSAVICGTAWASAVTDGRAAAGALLARLRANAEFAADYAAAKDELIAVSRAGTDKPQDCATEASAVAAMQF